LSVILSTGQSFEETQEKQNKHIKILQRNHAKKFSGEAVSKGQLSSFLVTSNPLIVISSTMPQKPNSSLLADVH
jgi:hypothetical protein